MPEAIERLLDGAGRMLETAEIVNALRGHCQSNMANMAKTKKPKGRKRGPKEERLVITEDPQTALSPACSKLRASAASDAPVELCGVPNPRIIRGRCGSESSRR